MNFQPRAPSNHQEQVKDTHIHLSCLVVILEVIARDNRARKGNKWHTDSKEEIKLSLLADNVIF